MKETIGYRLGVSLLALFLVFLGVQTLDLAPNVDARANVTAQADLAAIPTGALIPIGDTQTINSWNTTISAPGVYKMTNCLMGASGVGIVVKSNDVTILGENHWISGDGMHYEISAEAETGILIDNGSKVSISEVEFHDLDCGVQGNYTESGDTLDLVGNKFANNGHGVKLWNTAPLQGVTFQGNFFDNNAYGISWVNENVVRGANFMGDTLVGNTEGVYWHGEPGSQSQKVLFSGGYWFDNLSDIVWSDNGESDSVIYTHNKTVASGGVKFFVDHRGRNFTFTGNQFSYMGAPLSVYIEYGAERLSQVFVTGNQFMDAGRGVYVSNQTNSPLPDTLDVKGNTFVGGSRSYSPTIPLANINLYGGGNHISVVGNEISHGVNVSGIRFVGGPLVEHAQPFYNLRVTDNKVYALSGNDGTGTVSAVHFYNMPSNSTMMNAAASPAMPFVEFNAFYSNEGPGITYTKGAYDPLAHIEANHNWWGDPAGPTGPNGDGVVGDVLVDTWLAGLPQYLNLPLVIRY